MYTTYEIQLSLRDYAPSPTLYHACTNGPATRRQGGGGPYIPVLSEVESGLSPRK